MRERWRPVYGRDGKWRATRGAEGDTDAVCAGEVSDWAQAQRLADELNTDLAILRRLARNGYKRVTRDLPATGTGWAAWSGGEYFLKLPRNVISEYWPDDDIDLTALMEVGDE